MIKITNSYTQQTHEVDRIIGEYRGEQPGSQVLIFTAVHGNEPSGVFAMLNVFQKLHQDRPPMRGTITGICGNLRALEQGERYLEEDMNRMFTPERAQKILSDGAQHTEEEEMKTVLELTRAYQELEDEIFFVDCHTTSSHTEPYISLNAGYPLSYDFARGIPLCAVVGVERMLKGCLSEYLNKQDFHGFTYEAGQHDAKETIDCQEAMIWMALSHAGCLPVSYPAVEEAERTLSLHADKSGKLLKVTDAHAIAEGEQFVMKGGFHNLDPVRKDQHLAWSNDKELFAPADGRILMPLYQKKGNFGYFITTEVDVKTFVHEAREKAYAS